MPSGCQPFLTRRFELAVQFASGLHYSQCRKGTSIGDPTVLRLDTDAFPTNEERHVVSGWTLCILGAGFGTASNETYGSRGKFGR